MTKPDIGSIRIFDRETKFEILPHAADRFAQAAGAAAEGGLRISPAAEPPGASRGSEPQGRKPQRRGPPLARKSEGSAYGRRKG